jgi:hypothetical protein
MRTAAEHQALASRAAIVGLPKKLRAIRTNDPLADLDLNSSTGRRVRDLYLSYLEAMPGPVTIDLQAAIMAAAEATVIAEQARRRVLNGDKGVTYDDLVRLDAQADRKVRRLGLHQREPEHVPLRERLGGGA